MPVTGERQLLAQLLHSLDFQARSQHLVEEGGLNLNPGLVGGVPRYGQK